MKKKLHILLLLFVVGITNTAQGAINNPQTSLTCCQCCDVNGENCKCCLCS